MELPLGVDYDWLACDAQGHVARFSNAGLGPIPAVVLASQELADQAGFLMRGLPFIGESELCISLPDPNDFDQISRRGLFAYDWPDAYRKVGRASCYEIVSRPRRPLRVEELPPDLRRLAQLVKLGLPRFAFSDFVFIDQLPKCIS